MRSSCGFVGTTGTVGSGGGKAPGVVALQFVRYLCRGFPVSRRAERALDRIRANAASHRNWHPELLETWVLLTSMFSLADVLARSLASRLVPAKWLATEASVASVGSCS